MAYPQKTFLSVVSYLFALIVVFFDYFCCLFFLIIIIIFVVCLFLRLFLFFFLFFLSFCIDKKVEGFYYSLSEKKSKIYIERSVVSNISTV